MDDGNSWLTLSWPFETRVVRLFGKVNNAELLLPDFVI
jgi:hypothetical protein